MVFVMMVRADNIGGELACGGRKYVNLDKTGHATKRGVYRRMWHHLIFDAKNEM